MTKSGSYQQEIQTLAQVIKEKYQPDRIILFGSAARGELQRDSDIDMLIIKRSAKKKYERAVEILQLLKHVRGAVPLDPIVLTPEEFEKGKDEGRYLIRQILKEGKVLYEA